MKPSFLEKLYYHETSKESILRDSHILLGISIGILFVSKVIDRYALDYIGWVGFGTSLFGIIVVRSLKQIQ